MDDDRVIDKAWDALSNYSGTAGEADDAVTVSISTTPGEWLVNTVDAVVVPMSMAEVVEALQKQRLTLRSLVWRAGMQEWAPVDKVPQLKLAARLPVESAESPPPSRSLNPPPKPARASAAPPTAKLTPTLPSRKATLPFGPPPVSTPASRPSNPRPARPPHVEKTASEETEVLAVYARPTATTSFDLSPEQPLSSRAVQSTPLETLAPLTSDSARRRVAPAPSADLSVVAAAHFRQVQRSSKRLVVLSSAASAIAASLLTFWIAHSPSRSHTAPATSPPPVVAAPVAAPTPPQSASLAPVAVPAAPVDSVSKTPVPVSAAAPPKHSKPVYRPKPRAAAPVAKPVAETELAPAAAQPIDEPNPYETKVGEEAPKAKPAPDTARDSGLEPDSPSKPESGSASPGF